MIYPSIVVSSLPLAAAMYAQAPEADVKARSGSAVIKLFDREAVDRWAQCSWERLPVTAQNLVQLEDALTGISKPSEIPFTSTEENLLGRLNAACGDLLSPSDRNSVSFGVPRAKMRSLKEKRPASPAQKDQMMQVFVCAHKVSGKYVMTERNLQRPKPAKMLPGASVDCFKLESDGSLSHA